MGLKMVNPKKSKISIGDFFYLLKKAGAVVTGAGSGIGRETSLILARLGCRPVACDIDSDKLNKIVVEAKELGLEINPYQIDLIKVNQISSFAEDVESRDFPIHLLINCAGLCTGTAIEDIEEDEWDRLFGVNLKGLFYRNLSRKHIQEKEVNILIDSDISVHSGHFCM